MQVNIQGLEKEAVLAALYNRAQPQGMGFLQYNPQPMTTDDARQLLADMADYTYFDYVRGRVLKVDLSADDSFESSGYDRDNGVNAAAETIQSLRETQDVNNEFIRLHHENRKVASAMATAERMEKKSSIEKGDRGETIFKMGLHDMKPHLEPKLREHLPEQD